MKKLISLAVILCCIIGTTPMQAAVVDGTCGDSLTWSLNTKDSTLTITGSGAMTEYDYSQPIPWKEYKLYIAHLILPERLTSICSDAFYDCKNLESVVIPDSVTKIGTSAFSSCRNMTTLVFGTGLETIGDYAFSFCKGITSIEIPDNVTSIGSNAFAYCDNLTNVSIGSSIKSIGEEAFTGYSSTTGVVRLTVAATTPPSGGAACGIKAAECKLYVPEESIETYKNAVWWEDFKEILAIGTPDPLIDIEVQVTFTKGTPDAGVEVYGTFNDGKAVAMSYYQPYDLWWADIQASELQTINFREAGNPDNYIEVSYNGVSWAKLGDLVVSDYVFEQEGKNYIVLDFPNATGLVARWKVNTSCGDNLKWKVADGVLTITGTGDMWDYSYGTAPWGQAITSVVLPEGITSIGAYAFADCAELAEITIPTKVAKIGLMAFGGCNKLTKVVWNAADCPTLEEGEDIYPPFYAIRTQITDFTLGEDVVKVPLYLCYEMAIDSIYIPAKVTELGYGAFVACSKLSKVVWDAADCPTPEEGDNVYPPFYALRTQITNFTIGENAKVLPGYLCYDMAKIKEITIPAGVTSIGIAAFYGCTKAEVTALGETPCTLGNYALEGTKVVYVPCGTIDAYKKKWKAYASLISYHALDVTITGKVNIAEAGSVIVPTTTCDEAEVKAVANDGYRFVQWSDGNTDNPRAIELTADATYTAEFEKTEGIEDIEIDANLPRKAIRDGKVYILRGDKIYTVTGQEVK